jgi:cellulose 1,4-beta-cellobiosidase
LAPTPLAPLSAAILVAVLLISGAPASASNWALSIKTASTAEAQTQAAPPVPTGVSAACVSPTQQKVTVTWSAVAHAATYTIYKSATLAGSYSSTATGVTTTTWTSGVLATGNDYFKVAAYVGTKWVGAESAATGESTISGSGCTQP